MSRSHIRVKVTHQGQGQINAFESNALLFFFGHHLLLHLVGPNNRTVSEIQVNIVWK